MEEKQTSPLMKLRKFFEFENMKQFRDEWNELSDEDKQWFKDEIEKIVKD